MRQADRGEGRPCGLALYLALVAWLYVVQADAGSVHEDRIVSVSDGDTIIVLVESRTQVKVRPAAIDSH